MTKVSSDFKRQFEIGMEGENMAHHVIKNIFGVKGENLTQLDKAFYYNDKLYIVEVKHQEVYIPPPFYGHGLPKHQIRFRMKMYEQNGARPIFLVIEKSNNPNFEGKIYYQYLDVLENTEHFDTRGANPRRIYNVEHFEQISVRTLHSKRRVKMGRSINNGG